MKNAHFVEKDPSIKFYLLITPEALAGFEQEAEGLPVSSLYLSGNLWTETKSYFFLQLGVGSNCSYLGLSAGFLYILERDFW